MKNVNIYGIKVATNFISEDMNVHAMLLDIHVNAHRNISKTVQFYLYLVTANCFKNLCH